MTIRFPTHATITRPAFDQTAPWLVTIPPFLPEHYDGDDPNESPILGPWGDSTWRTWDEACAFVAMVFAECVPTTMDLLRDLGLLLSEE